MEFTGVLKDYTADEIVLDIDGEEKRFFRKDLALIRLALNF